MVTMATKYCRMTSSATLVARANLQSNQITANCCRHYDWQQLKKPNAGRRSNLSLSVILKTTFTKNIYFRIFNVFVLVRKDLCRFVSFIFFLLWISWCASICCVNHLSGCLFIFSVKSLEQDSSYNPWVILFHIIIHIMLIISTHCNMLTAHSHMEINVHLQTCTDHRT